MNIKTNELLLLNKIKFAGKENPAGTATLDPEKAGTTPDKAMQALSFKGLENLLSNPKLAQSLGVANDVEMRKGDASYVAPFSTNVAFKANPGKMAKIGVGVLMGAAALGTTSSLQSCKPWDPRGDLNITQEVTIDMSQFTEMMAQLMTILNSINSKLDKLDKQNEILGKMQDALLQILGKVSNMEITIEQGFQQLFNQFILNNANQEIIIQAIYENTQKTGEGNQTLEEIKSWIQQLVKEVQDGKKTAEEAWKEIMAKLDTTNGLLSNIYNYMQQAFQKLEAYMNDMRADAKLIIHNQNIQNAALQRLIKNSDLTVAELNTLIIGQETMTAKIQAAIEDQTLSINDNVNAKLDQIAGLLNMTRAQLIATMDKWGITQAQITGMSVYQLLNAINDNTKEIKALRTVVTTLLEEYRAGKISAEEFAQKILDELDKMNATLADIYSVMQEVNAKIDKYAAEAKLDAIAIINNTGRTADEVAKLREDVQGLKASVDGISGQLSVVIEQQEATTVRIENAISEGVLDINGTLGDKIDATNDKLDKLAGLLNMTRAQLISTMNRWGITQAQLLGMSVYQLVGAIKENTAEVKNLQTQFADFVAKYEAGQIDAKAFAEGVLALLKDIKAGIDSMNITLTNLYNEVKDGFVSVNTNLAEISKNGTVTNEILNKMNENIVNISIVQEDYHAELQELIALLKADVANGSEILAEIKSHPEKYAEMLANIGLTAQQIVNMAAEDVVKAIEKHDKNTQTSFGTQLELLQKIYDKLATIDGQTITDPEVLAALKAIAVAVNNGNDVTEAQLKALLEKLDGIADQLDEIIDQLKGIKAYVQNMSVQLGKYNEYWQLALGKLDDYSADLAEIKAKLDAGNANMEEIKELIKKANALLAEVKANQIKAEAYLNSVVSNGNIIIEKLEGMKDIDYDRMEAAWKEISDTDYERYSKLIKDLKIDPSKFDNIADLINAIKVQLGDIQNDTKYGKKIYDLLNGIDWTKPDYTAKLNRIIELLEGLACCCGNNEGIIGELEDLLNGNG